MRWAVNKLLDWRGVPVLGQDGKTRVITLAGILRSLGSINEGRDAEHRITYSCLRIHANRHYELAGKVAYFSAQMDRELRNALGGKRR